MGEARRQSSSDVFLGLGSNLGDRWGHLSKAVGMVARHPLMKLEALSPVYASEPLYYVDQPNFLNMALAIGSELSPGRLLKELKLIERRVGRRPTFQNGPRAIDIDVIYFAGLTRRSRECIIPHPRLHERRFVLAPLADIAPGFVDPVRKKSVSRLLAECADDSAIKRLTRSMRVSSIRLTSAA